MPPAKHKNGKVGAAPYFRIIRDLTGNANFFGILGDHGALIDALKLHNVSAFKQDQLVRMKYIERVTGHLSPVECRCGMKFDSEESRQAHIDKRHLAKTSNVKDFNECSEEERAQILAATEEYNTSQYDFHVPDPDDRRAAVEDRRLEQSIDWTQTAASKK